MEDKKKKILICSSGFVGGKEFLTAFGDVKLKQHDMPQIVVVPEKKFTIEVNGVEYEKIEHKKPSGRVAALMAMAETLSPNMGGSDYERKRPAVDIVKEYGLIELKQSKLSRNDRDWVKWQFQMNYKKVSDHNNS